MLKNNQNVAITFASQLNTGSTNTVILVVISKLALKNREAFWES